MISFYVQLIIILKSNKLKVRKECPLKSKFKLNFLSSCKNRKLKIKIEEKMIINVMSALTFKRSGHVVVSR